MNKQLSTSRVTKAMKHEEPKVARDFSSGQRKGATNSQAPEIRATNGSIPSKGEAGRFGGFLSKKK